VSNKIVANRCDERMPLALPLQRAGHRSATCRRDSAKPAQNPLRSLKEFFMNTRNLMLVIAALAGSGAALAQSQESKTRAEVRAEALAARQAGEIEVGDTAGLRQLLPAPSPRSRADVRAEAAAANKLQTRAAGDADGALLDNQLSAPSTLSRAQVRAEAIEWRRLGLIGYGDHEQRAPTPAELESVRQAGLRAIGIQNMATR
jgi:hypothetical protein